MKKDTKKTHAHIVDNALYYIYRHLDTNITLDELAHKSGVSPYHFHRIFQEQLHETFYHKLQSIRLQKAANLLITNQYSNISEIAQACGYGSHSSFIRTFKSIFGVTPTVWRKGYYKTFSRQNIAESTDTTRFDGLEPTIEMSQEITVGYIRYKGYNRGITKVWNRIRAYCLESGLPLPRQIGIHHDNPSIVPLESCSYVAAIEINKTSPLAQKLSVFTIPKTLCAIFHYQGSYGEVLSLIRYIYHGWLPGSGYEAKTLPPFVIYHKNHFLSDDERFEIDFYLPIQTI